MQHAANSVILKGLRTEVKRFIDATVAPTPGDQRQRLARLFGMLIDGGVFPYIDAAYLIAGQDAQASALNLKNPGTFTLTAVNSPTFTPFRGYAGNGSSSYLDTGWIPSTHGVNYTLNSASLGSWLHAGTDTLSGALSMGCSDGTGSASMIFPWFTANALRGRVNNNASLDAVPTGTITTRLGFSAISRITTGFAGYRNGALVGTNGAAATGVPTTSLWIGGINGNGVLGSPLDNRTSFAFMAAYLTAAQHFALYDALRIYNLAVGNT